MFRGARRPKPYKPGSFLMLIFCAPAFKECRLEPEREQQASRWVASVCTSEWVDPENPYCNPDPSNPSNQARESLKRLLIPKARMTQKPKQVPDVPNFRGPGTPQSVTARRKRSPANRGKYHVCRSYNTNKKRYYG